MKGGKAYTPLHADRDNPHQNFISRKRQRTSISGDDAKAFRNVRIAEEEVLEEGIFSTLQRYYSYSFGFDPDPTRMDAIRPALLCLYSIKAKYPNNPAIYNQFLELMRCFKDCTLGVQELTEKTVVLFNGDPELLQSFSQFLPSEYSINSADQTFIRTPRVADTYTSKGGDIHLNG